MKTAPLPTLALTLALALAAGAALAQARPGAEDDSVAQQCYAGREVGGPKPDFCQGLEFLEAEGKVLEVELRRHHLRLEHAALPGGNPAGVHDYYVEPAYLLAAVAVGDEVHFVVESRNGHVIDVYPLLGRR